MSLGKHWYYVSREHWGTTKKKKIRGLSFLGQVQTVAKDCTVVAAFSNKGKVKVYAKDGTLKTKFRTDSNVNVSPNCALKNPVDNTFIVARSDFKSKGKFKFGHKISVYNQEGIFLHDWGYSGPGMASFIAIDSLGRIILSILEVGLVIFENSGKLIKKVDFPGIHHFDLLKDGSILVGINGEFKYEQRVLILG